MSFEEYLEITSALSERRSAKSGHGGERNLRPIQKTAIQRAKDLKK